MTKAIVIPVEGPVTTIELGEDSLKQLQEAVGGWIEAVPIPSFIPMAWKATAYVNEEGKIEKLPTNRRATDFFVPGAGLQWGDYIAGPCVVVGFDPETGEHTEALPNAVERRILRIEREAGS